MTQITVKDASGTNTAVARVVNTGSAADADSLPVAKSTEDKAVAAAAAASLAAIDDWDESDRAKVNPIVGQAGVAAGAGAVGATVQRFTLASDDPAVAGIGAAADAAATAGSTGTLSAKLRLLTSQVAALILQLPASLGIKTAANSISFAPASDAVFSVASQPATLTDRSGTITTGGAAQQVEASTATRRGYSVQNNSVGDLWVSTLATAVASQPSIRIPPGGMFETPLGGGGTGAISIIGATTGQAFTARTWV